MTQIIAKVRRLPRDYLETEVNSWIQVMEAILDDTDGSLILTNTIRYIETLQKKVRLRPNSAFFLSASFHLIFNILGLHALEILLWAIANVYVNWWVSCFTQRFFSAGWEWCQNCRGNWLPVFSTHRAKSLEAWTNFTGKVLIYRLFTNYKTCMPSKTCIGPDVKLCLFWRGFTALTFSTISRNFQIPILYGFVNSAMFSARSGTYTVTLMSRPLLTSCALNRQILPPV